MRRGTAFTVGWWIGVNGTAQTLSPSSYAVAMAFIAAGSSVSVVRLPITAVGSGGVPAGYLRCRIVGQDAANNYLPDLNYVLATAYSTNDANAAGVFVEFSGFGTHTLTVGERYWVVFDNIATAGTVTVQPADYTIMSSFTFSHACASNSSGTWTYAATARRLGEHIVFSNGNIVHECVNTYNAPDSTAVYGASRMAGVLVRVGSVGLRIVGLAVWGARVGSGCTIAASVLDASNNVLATTYSMLGAWESSHAVRYQVFPEPVTLAAGTYYRIVLRSPVGDGDSSNHYRLTLRLIPYDTNTIQELCGGMFTELQSTETTDGGSTWSNTTTRLPRAFLLALDPDQPFVAPTSVVPALNRGVW